EELVSAVPAAPEAPPKEKAPEGEKKAEEPAENVSPKKVLIVDDQKVNLVVLRTMLKKLGSFEIVMAGNGQEAFEILSSAEVPFDLVLTDMWMPVMDGEGLVRAIRADGKLASLPVHVVTADTEMPGKFRQIGFDGILLKPVTVEKLKGLVNT
ncbi:MAG: response regulator, partial [Lentisphaeria bacterium]|nr:response regulator [Lentisphaeria bacterium]